MTLVILTEGVRLRHYNLNTATRQQHHQILDSAKKTVFNKISELNHRTNKSSPPRPPSRSDRFNWGRGSPGGLGEEIEIFPGPLA